MDNCRLCMLPVCDGVDLFESVDRGIPYNLRVKDIFQIEVIQSFPCISCIQANSIFCSRYSMWICCPEGPAVVVSK